MFTISVKSNFNLPARDLTFKTESAMYSYFLMWVYADDEVYYFNGETEYTPWWAR